ncbi:unnamed protein product [Ixodes persulcatus]
MCCTDVRSVVAAPPRSFSPAPTTKASMSDDDSLPPEVDFGVMRCTCENCPLQEGQCCRDVPRVARNCLGRCITRDELFWLVCLDERLLDIAYEKLKFYEPTYLEPVARDRNKKYRFTAYKEFVWWIWGMLGRRRRVRLPCCVVGRIREQFPSATYTGFQYC